MTFLDDDDLDPALAERFLLLDRLTPPAEVRRMAPAEPPVIILDQHRSRRQILWAAAAIAVIAAASIALVLDRGPSSGLDTTDPADGPTVTAERGAEDDPVSSGRLEAHDPDAPEAGAPVAPDDDGRSSRPAAAPEGDESAGADPSGDDPAASMSTASGPTSSSTTSSGPPASATSATTVPAGPTTVATGPTSTGATTPTTASATTASTTASTTTTESGRPGKDTRVVVRGLVTEVFTDCVSHLVLEGGDVVSRIPVSCDGGSWIVVDGRRIQTSSGLTGGGGFDNHDPDLQPGQQAKVNAVSPAGGGGLTLDCPGCHIVAR